MKQSLYQVTESYKIWKFVDEDYKRQILNIQHQMTLEDFVAVEVAVDSAMILGIGGNKVVTVRPIIVRLVVLCQGRHVIHPVVMGLLRVPLVPTIVRLVVRSLVLHVLL